MRTKKPETLPPKKASSNRAWRLGAAALALLSSSACGVLDSQSPEASSATATLAQGAIVGSRIQAETWASISPAGAVFNEGGGEGQSVAGFQVGETLRWNSVNCGSADQIQFRLAAPYAGGKAEIWADAVGSGTKLGELSLTAATGGDWNTFATKTVSISRISGSHNLFLKAVGTGGDWLFKLDWFELHDSGGGTNPPPPPPPPPPGDYIPVVVTNKCGFELYAKASSAGVPFEAGRRRLAANGGTTTYNLPKHYESGRVEVYRNSTVEPELEKVEMTFLPKNGYQEVNYNVTYVDHVGLPVSVKADGPSTSDCAEAACNQRASDLLSGCPDNLIESAGGGSICQSPRTYCLRPENRSKPLCTKLDAKIAECASRYPDCTPGTDKTPEVYACSGVFFYDPGARQIGNKYCAALNRGMLHNPTTGDASQYYKTGPFNNYSAWVHQKCPRLYAFAYDDYPGGTQESGYHSCVNGTRLNMVFCPNG